MIFTNVLTIMCVERTINPIVILWIGKDGSTCVMCLMDDAIESMKYVRM